MKHIYKLRDFLSKYRAYRFLCYVLIAILYVPIQSIASLLMGIFLELVNVFNETKAEYKRLVKVIKKDLEVL